MRSNKLRLLHFIKRSTGDDIDPAAKRVLKKFTWHESQKKRGRSTRNYCLKL